MARFSLTWIPATLMFAGLMQAQKVELQVELMNQIGTDTSRKGDIVSGRVSSPAQLQGDIIEGKITESKSGAKLGGKSAFSFSFDTLRHGGAAIPINSEFRSATNSKGKVNVDEEGRMVRRGTGNVAKAAGGTGFGALVGGLAGGGRGAAIGAAVGAGASIALIQIAADGPNIRFSPGSRFVIEAGARDGSSLLALRPSQPVVAAAPAEVAAPAAAPAAPAPAAAPAPQPAAQPAAAAEPAQAAPAASPQPVFTELKAEFVPGEKTIFYDDFTDMAPGDAPPHFKVRGASVELSAAGNLRQLSVTQQRASLFPNLTSLPKNFTYEAEIKFVATGRSNTVYLILMTKNTETFKYALTVGQDGTTQHIFQKSAPYEELGRTSGRVNVNEPVKTALWIQNGRVRVYCNGERVLDANQVDLPLADKVEFLNEFYGGTKSVTGYRMVRFAESTPDFSQVIASSGRYVTHGILFDTDSDILKPESAPVIRAIARGLSTNPNLRLLIEGHTDSVGNADHNLDLSKRRAEAVKAVLVSQFSVDASRLTTAGLGASKPIDSNDTPQGRAQNRRVELVKQ